MNNLMTNLKPYQRLTNSQRSRFFALLRSAIINLGVAAGDAETYRRRVIREECGVDSLKDVNRTTGYDRLMARLAVDSGDYQGAINYGTGTLTRIHYLIGKAAAAVCSAEHVYYPSAWYYVAGVLRQCGYDKRDCRMSDLAVAISSPNYWMDLTEDQCKRVLMMLQSQLNRLRKGVRHGQSD